MKKRAFPVILTALLMLTGCGYGQTASDFKEPKYYEPYEISPIRNRYNFDYNADWYKDFLDQVRGFNTTVITTERIDKHLAKSGIQAMSSTCPEVFWIDSYYYAPSTDASKIDFNIKSCVEEDKIPEMYNELMQKAQDIADAVPSDYSDYEKILYVHDHIADITVYDYSAVENPKASLAYTAYGCLVEGKAVCQGYAEAFTLVMNLLGIENGVVIGDTYLGYHAWNYVKLDGNYYWLDITWDDQDSTFPTSHTYFLFTDELLSRTRYPDLDLNYFSPECTSLDKYIPAEEMAYLSTYDKEAVKQVMERHSDDKYCDIVFDSFEAYSAAMEALLRDGELSSIARKAWGSGSVKYYSNDHMLTLTVISTA